MSDPAPEEERAPAEPFWRSRSVGGALVVGLLSASSLVALYLESKPPLDIADAVRTIEARVEEKRRPKWLAALRAACRRHDCACATKAAGLGLDAEAADAVLGLVEQAASCGPAEFGGFRSEALIRKGRDRTGLEEASRVIDRAPDNPNALYAMALLTYRAKSLESAMRLAVSSERAGRGWSSTLLVGLVAYEAGDFERARGAFRTLLADDPDDVDALWNLGVAAQKEGRYGEARTSYLKVARLRPGHADARHNLAILTHSVGALDEAKHHFELFEKSSPNDPRIGTLRANLAEAPEHGTALSLTPPAPIPSAAGSTPR